MKKRKWICFHIGSRAHYQIPRALLQNDGLAYLVTDSWIKKSVFTYILNKILPGTLFKKLLQRNHRDLKKSKIISFTLSLLLFELYHKIIKVSGWDLIIKRNNWFLKKASKELALIPLDKDQDYVVFSICYTALDIFQYAKKRNLKTVLFQMDPGIIEEQIIQKEQNKLKKFKSFWQPAPPAYWSNWLLECELADRIMVNSSWSKEALIKINIPEHKIKIIPLAYEPEGNLKGFLKTYPIGFTTERPLVVLFLGTLTVRKGMAPLLEAIELMVNEPIEFWFVGMQEFSLIEHPKVKYIPSVSRTETASYYKKADVFIFPTLSDGFGLTQLEALSWKLPVISSRYCAEVVKDNINGIVLKEVNREAIKNALQRCLTSPGELQNFSNNTEISIKEFSFDKFRENVLNIFD
jgi:glycosyltransferase involved in cell wall biosynthesis